MIISGVVGNIGNSPVLKSVDWLMLEWYEAGKRILHKHTQGGREIMMRFLNQHDGLQAGDIIYEDADLVIAVDILVCDAISVKPKSMFEMAAICYEIGNKHLPIFYQDDEVLVAFEPPLFRVLTNAGYGPKRENRKLINPIKTTVLPHGNMMFDKNANIENP